MILFDPFKAKRRRERLEREALEEAYILRRKHADAAVEAAKTTLQRPDLTSWGRKVMDRAIELLQAGKA
jgi:hypothetical protein